MAAMPSAASKPQLTFDLTMTSIFVPLASGGRIVVYPERDSRADLAVFGQVMPLLAWPMRTPVADTAKATPVLRDWAGRIHTAAFGVSPDP